MFRGTLSNGPVNGLTVSGNTGIGTSSPSSKLHVQLGGSGTTPFANTTLTLENSTNNYLSLLAPNNSESGILFGNVSSNVSGGIVYNSGFFGTAPNGLQFRTNGNVPRMVITSEGKVALGPTLDPSIYRIKIDHAGNGGFGIDFANSSKSSDWEFFVGTGGLSLFVDGGAGGPKGIFNRSTGVYSSISDERAKTNIKPMSNVLEKISRLKAASYQFKNSVDKEVYDGFIAQQVMQVFPNLVTHNIEAERHIDEYLLNYSGFGVIAIKGIQELMKQNDSLKSEVENLKSEIMQIKSMLITGSQSTGSGAGKTNIVLTDASLGQNVPNPVANATSIGYNIPSIISSAEIIITDRNGRTMKQLNIPAGKGTINIDASALTPGTYNYSLIVNGKIISTKQMMVVK